ncbi:restriction endonuclease subunit S [Paucibacter sp. M5-1]|uniref:restriction endonuclease subunit S n=1 Tax=Paucibacter sp. M5-1 TaxID=3015998 RepID=UPI0022B87ED8|nr:restriction endonuclease subunit S [Paucibacter sp. M5-1]MCZ7881903.1 restriction endonuclease subunit S [Paucibacter sp. M5-1]
MSLPRYGEYKDSGVAWFDKVPVHWEPSVLKRVVSRIESGVSVNAVDAPASSGEPGVLKTSCVYAGNFDPSENKAVVEDELSRVACPVTAGTLIVSRMNTPALVGAAGFVAESAENLFLPDRLWQVHFVGASAKFVHCWTNSPSYRAQVQMACAGTSASMQNLSQDEFLRFVLPLPSPSEQAAIAAFLDHETAKIDALIAEQEKLIALLAEKRQATISHAVTKGLNPSAPMKDSDVAWLGEVPAHWDVKPLGFLCLAISYGFTNPMPTTDDGPYLLTANDVAMGSVNYETARRTSAEAFRNELTEKSRPKLGDILVTKDGTLGRVALFDGPEACINQSVASLRVDSKLALPRFLSIALAGGVYQERMVFDAGGTTIKHIYISRLGKMAIALPPPFEQGRIVAHVEAEQAKLDALVSEAKNGIALLQERRSALIAAAVTGQIDVRHVPLR